MRIFNGDLSIVFKVNIFFFFGQNLFKESIEIKWFYFSKIDEGFFLLCVILRNNKFIFLFYYQNGWWFLFFVMI